MTKHNSPLLGSHMSLSKSTNYLEGVVNETVNQNANTFMIFTGAPQNTKRVPVETFKIAEMNQLIDYHEIDKSKLVVHAPYLINLSNPVNETVWKFSIDFLLEEIKRCEALGIHLLVLHPGAYTKGSLEQGLQQLIKALDLVTDYESPVLIALETMSGKGTEVGGQLDDLAFVLQQVKKPERIGVCLDTCHLHDAGYQIQNWPEFKNNLKQLLPLDKVKVIHLNDSKNVCGAKKDRHENIGYGQIGFDTLVEIVWDEELTTVPKILETPYIDNLSPYKKEIKCLLSRSFNQDLK
ncbi:endonuclease IV [Entomoplasma freundtii]|uniref:Probable endonuclease 4 n=1 Tax=Entomoplasma freundtii TaxID=74700 RepID=A0A2K8NQH3_9MOLU|nr:deoxyribonuclease IV [Entomoplasma freundtii]ATZ16044.1 endonuclease IV [Entomoplasma freundtii]TDY58087.1 endonuclease IV [Entomoplasma freundtii]